LAVLKRRPGSFFGCLMMLIILHEVQLLLMDGRETSHHHGEDGQKDKGGKKGYSSTTSTVQLGLSYSYRGISIERHDHHSGLFVLFVTLLRGHSQARIGEGCQMNLYRLMSVIG
jgi:hypothetical protein